jgi:hypothetical protein
MQLRIQAMFFAAFVIAYAMFLASMASADSTSDSSSTTLSKAHQSALTHAQALSKYLSGKDSAKKEILLSHSDAIGTALQEAAQASTALATEVKANKAKDCVETMREHQSDAADQHKKLTDQLTQAPIDAAAIRTLASDIASEVRDAEKENKRVASIERIARKDATQGRVPVEQAAK